MKAEEVKPYDEADAKGRQVEAMFDNIAPAYDFMNTAMTFGMHRRWLRKALAEMQTAVRGDSSKSILDLATGTGDVAFKLAEMFPDARITGVDLSEGMLAVARKKKEEHPEGSRIVFQQGDCLALPFSDACFDLLSIAYGVRNFEDLKKGLLEFHRVLSPGGVCMILELSRPENRFVRPFYDLYSRTLIPLIGRMVSKDSRAYSYLPESIAAMPPRSAVEGMLREAGFKKVESKTLTLGVVTIYIASK